MSIALEERLFWLPEPVHLTLRSSSERVEMRLTATRPPYHLALDNVWIRITTTTLITFGFCLKRCATLDLFESMLEKSMSKARLMPGVIP